MSGGYGQFCPFAQASEVFCERWTPLIIREVLQGSRRFTDILRGVPKMSRTLLAERLKALESRGVLEKRGGEAGPEYHPTPACLELGPVVMTLGAWGQKWIHKGVKKEHEDPSFVVWSLRQGIVVDRMPATRTVIEFELSETKKRRRYWLAVTPPEVDLCIVNPGYEVQIALRSDARTLASVWTGDLSWKEALRSGALALEGPPPLVDAFAGWFRLNPFAG